MIKRCRFSSKIYYNIIVGRTGEISSCNKYVKVVAILNRIDLLLQLLNYIRN